MRTLPWLSLSTLLVLASTGCPADDDGGQDTDSSSSTGDDSDATTMTTATTASTTVSTSDSTTASTTDSTTDTTTDSTTVSTTDSSESGTTDPDTSGTAESEGSSGGSDGTSAGTDTGMGDCPPSGDACQDCLVVENCCAEYVACFEDADCTCILTCVGGGEELAICFDADHCDLQESPPPFDPLVGCLQAADCDQACA